MFQGGPPLLHHSDMNSLQAPGTAESGEHEQGHISQDTLDGLDGKIYIKSNYIKYKPFY